MPEPDKLLQAVRHPAAFPALGGPPESMHELLPASLGKDIRKRLPYDLLHRHFELGTTIRDLAARIAAEGTGQEYREKLKELVKEMKRVVRGPIKKARRTKVALKMKPRDVKADSAASPQGEAIPVLIEDEQSSPQDYAASSQKQDDDPTMG